MSISLPYLVGETISGDITQQHYKDDNDGHERINLKAIYEKNAKVNNFKENRQIINFVEKLLSIIERDRNHQDKPFIYLAFLKNYLDQQK